MTQSSRRLAGKVALVTGAGQGVGQGIARGLAGAGATVVIAQRNVQQGEEAAQALRQDFGVEVLFVPTDVTLRDQAEQLVHKAEEAFGRLDILVNNAGGSFPKRLEHHSDEEMEGAMLLNFWSAFWTMRAAFPGMKKRRWGRIINLGSLNGVNAHTYTAAYNTSKEAVRALTRTAAVEWAQYGINSNVICPGVGSPASDAYERDNPEMMASIRNLIPRRKLGDAEQDVGPVAVFLGSDDSAHVNGMTMFVDGGAHINGVPWRPEVDDEGTR